MFLSTVDKLTETHDMKWVKSDMNMAAIAFQAGTAKNFSLSDSDKSKS